MSKIDELEKQLDTLSALSKDEQTEKYKWKNNKVVSLSKKVLKKPDHVLVQYLRANYTMDFMLCKVISGNIIVIDSKGHELNPKDVWRHGKFLWYIIREIDTKPVTNNDYSIVRKLHRHTDNHPILMKMVLGATIKKEMSPETKKWIIWIIVGIAAIVGVYALFFMK